jgi:Transposase zinc-binding domain/Putative transposase
MSRSVSRQLPITEFAHKAANGELTITCRNRHCPKCPWSAAAWLAAREAELLPVPYFHFVFALPAVIGAMARFLLHVLPNGFHRICHYGLLANGHRADKLAPCRRLLAVSSAPEDGINDDNDPSARNPESITPAPWL